MGGQACILYGAAEFSRDADLAIYGVTDNLNCLQAALSELKADRIAVPPFEKKYLDMGLAVHFRCRHPEAENLRIDVMSRMRGVATFEELYERRTTMEINGQSIEVLGLPDLVQAKKTQRDKDWPMITRLVEADYFSTQNKPSSNQLHFWLMELRTPEILIELAKRYSDQASSMVAKRPLLKFALDGNGRELTSSLKQEEENERAADRAYWIPLRRLLEELRTAERTGH